MTDWTEINDHHHAAAAAHLVQHGGLLMTFILHTPVATQIIGVPEFDDHQRDMLPTLLRLLCTAQGATALTHISEAWTLELKPEPGESDAAFEARARNTRPSDRA